MIIAFKITHCEFLKNTPNNWFKYYFVYIYCNLNTKKLNIICGINFLFVPLHHITDKFNDYDSRIQH